MEFIDLQNKAREYLEQDKYNEAINLYEQCITANPHEMSNYWQLGIALLLQGEELAAQSCWLSPMMTATPSEVTALTAELITLLEVTALQYLRGDKFLQAEQIYTQILEYDLENSAIYKNLGEALLKQGKLVEAIASYQEYINLNPEDINAYYNLGLLCQTSGRMAEAIAYYQQCLNLQPNYYEVLNNLGVIFQMQGKIEEAIFSYQQALKLNPQDAKSYYNLGYIFQKEGKIEEAIAYYQQSLILDANQPIVMNNLGYALEQQGKKEAAINYYQQALILNENYQQAYYNLAVLYIEKSEFEQAINCLNRAIEIEPTYADAHWNRGLILLRWGDYKQGFAEYEWRWQRKSNPPRPFSESLWDGANFEGKTILIHGEQGLGDIIQFIRYAPLVAERGGNIIVECQQPLVRLLTTVSGVKQVVALGEELPEFDIHIPLMSLPYIFKTTLTTVPAKIPYIKPVESVDFPLHIPEKTDLKVGIVWAGQPQNYHDHNRSCSLKYFEPILNIPNIAFYSLQKGAAVKELTLISEQINLQDLSNQLSDFADTAAVVAQLDLIITVDTSVAHLAGALGHSVWVLLCYNADWRWMMEREDSPWYPDNMRLFRQKQPGDWTEVFRRVRAALVI